MVFSFFWASNHTKYFQKQPIYNQLNQGLRLVNELS
jgi:hypothetical protein